MKLVDLTGQKFGRLAVLERAPDYITPSGQHKTRWHCICECGNECDVDAYKLRVGESKSCGCLKADTMSITMRKQNKYDWNNPNYLIGYTTNNEKFYLDKEDYELVKDYCWHINKRGYVAAKGGRLLMHRLFLPDSQYVDHINHDKTDNRRNNIRPVSVFENNRNMKLRSDNSSGVTGITYRSDSKKWRAYIGCNSEHICLGDYDKFDDAVKARKEAEEKYFGEYSYDNSMQQSKQIKEDMEDGISEASNQSD